MAAHEWGPKSGGRPLKEGFNSARGHQSEGSNGVRMTYNRLCMARGVKRGNHPTWAGEPAGRYRVKYDPEEGVPAGNTG